MEHTEEEDNISFGIGGKIMIFGEHQSIINENMPIRSLMYIGRAYEQLVPVKDRYKRKLVHLPKPEFYTFYNGTEHWSKEKVLRLSEAYEIQDEDYMLELQVRVININPGENHEVLDKCPVLKEYGLFVDTVRGLQKSGDTDAFKHAVEKCIEQGILKDYLEKKGSEVVNMLIAEYDYDMDIEVQREEAYTEGLEKGKAEGLQEGKAEGLLEGKAEGLQEGRDQKLIEVVKKKLSKGKSPEEIAEILEEPPEEISRIIRDIHG